MSKTTTKNLIIVSIACMIVTMVVIGGKALAIQFPEYSGEFEFLRFFLSWATISVVLLLPLAES